MGKGTKALAGIIGLLLVFVVGWNIFAVPVSMRIVDRMFDRAAGANFMDTLPDGLHVGLCGSSGPLTSANRAAGCAFVIAGKDFYIIDAGGGSAENISLMRLPTGALKGVFLTHFHSDHIDGLGELLMNRWIQGRNTEPLPVYGSQGVERIVSGLREAYALDASYRTAHHGEEVAPTTGSGGVAFPFDFSDSPIMGPRVIHRESGLVVTAFKVDHEPIEAAVGYRFDYKGRSVVITGDTVRSSSVAVAAKGVDVLVHEAMQMEVMALMEAKARENNRPGIAKVLLDAAKVHTSPVDAAEIAQEAGARYLLLTHIVPGLPAFMDKMFLGDAKKRFDGPITIGVDGFMLSLPVGTNEIIERDLL